jgi:hypothetical protein
MDRKKTSEEYGPMAVVIVVICTIMWFYGKGPFTWIHLPSLGGSAQTSTQEQESSSHYVSDAYTGLTDGQRTGAWVGSRGFQSIEDQKRGINSISANPVP